MPPLAAHYEQLVKQTGLSLDQLEEQITTQADQWQVLVPEQMKSVGGATLQVQQDQSVLVSGANPATDTYEVVLKSEAAQVNAVRLEARKDPSTVNGGAGRGSNGNFVLSEFEVEVARRATTQPISAKSNSLAPRPIIRSRIIDIKLAIDGKADRTGWAVDGNTKTENRTAMFLFRQPVGSESGTILRIRMIHKFGGSHHIARFRLAVHQSDKPPLSTAISAIVSKPTAKRSAAEKTQLRDWLLLISDPMKSEKLPASCAGSNKSKQIWPTTTPRP